MTGSRDWSDAKQIRAALARAVVFLNPDMYDSVTIIHGACPRGVDKLMDEYASSLERLNPDLWHIERHPADWSYGNRAGPDRNALMVSLGADVCLAFIGPCTSSKCKRAEVHGSHGASNTVDLARAAGIPVIQHHPLDGTHLPVVF